ncbi:MULTISPECIES: L,D-transpeptidase [unclassified Micromonospora]|uniref:L,D-transpeptidase family protein n=1 Tax=unclassified Micromonospora TaxID=2617518 RepID=UPI000EF54943|nr:MULTISPECIES: L,D-transpeptidase [unclassified Micromonospora]RLP87703.1 L,D-transpeptidase [Micromonospora sp. BL4]RLP96906.1 L,D-transpeptidase [Micromonospora sp. CV4]
MPFDRMTPSRRRGGWVAAAVAVAALLIAALLVGQALTPRSATTDRPVAAAADPTPSSIEQSPEESVPPAAPAPDGLPVVDYDPAPKGFPADPATMDTTPLTEGVHPTRRIAAYDAPGGRPLAFLEPTLAGVELTVPIAERRAGWTAVLLPSANRRLAWLPSGGFDTVALRDQIVVERKVHRLTWYRAGKAVRSWQTSLGQSGQETPLGRTFILGRTPPPQDVYGGVDIYALGSVPDDPSAVPASLRGAHIGVHTWYNDDELGENTTNGCIRITRSGQRELLAEVRPGSSLVVVDQLPTPPPTA